MTANALPVSLLLFLLSSLPPPPSPPSPGRTFLGCWWKATSRVPMGFLFVCGCRRAGLPDERVQNYFQTVYLACIIWSWRSAEQGRPTRGKGHQQGSSPGRVIIINTRGRSRSPSPNRHRSCFMSSFGTVG